MRVVVSGFPRSGTSMMMGCLVSGGMPPYYSSIREDRMKRMRKDDYVINTDFYEVGQDQYMNLGFSSELPDNICVKIQAIGLPLLAGAKYWKIIMMRRDPEAIRESYKGAFGKQSWNRMKESQCWPEYYYRRIDGVKSIMEARRDVELIELWYDDVLADPVSAMQKINAMGIPIDTMKAASYVDDKKRRYGT
jgi:hypothetical protein